MVTSHEKVSISTKFLRQYSERDLGSSGNNVCRSEFIVWPWLRQGRWQTLRQLCDKGAWLRWRPPGSLCKDFQCWLVGKIWLREFFWNVLPLSLTCFVCAGFVQGFPYVWLLSSFLPALALSDIERRVLLFCKGQQQHRWGQSNLVVVCTVCLCWD